MKAAEATMAQLSSAQREPSMEEILASIRRIIEDSDTGSDISETVRPDNDVPVALAEPASNDWEPETQPAATVIEVDAFRSELRSNAQNVEPAKSFEGRSPISLAEVQAQVAADQIAARAAAESAYHGEIASKAAPSQTTSPDAALDIVPSRAPESRDWSLNVQPAPDSAAVNVRPAARHEDTTNAVFDDISARQVRRPSAEVAVREPRPTVDAAESRKNLVADQAARQVANIVPDQSGKQVPSLISDQAGKQVAASFGELSEILATRNKKSLDETAQEMLRPMLQDWLDNNLPLLVERLVREEIERVARGA